MSQARTESHVKEDGHCQGGFVYQTSVTHRWQGNFRIDGRECMHVPVYNRQTEEKEIGEKKMNQARGVQIMMTVLTLELCCKNDETVSLSRTTVRPGML